MNFISRDEALKKHMAFKLENDFIGVKRNLEQLRYNEDVKVYVHTSSVKEIEIELLKQGYNMLIVEDDDTYSAITIWL